MSNLSGFLAQNKVKTDNIFYPASKSFLDENGEVLKWELRALTTDEDVSIRDSCQTIEVTKKRQKVSFNSNLYYQKMVAKSVVFPDLLNAELQDSYGVKNEFDLLGKMLLPGEFADLSAKVTDLCGFDAMDEQVDEVKN